MTTATTPVVVLDSSVLFSRVLHELFGRLALETGLFTIVYSDELLAETERVLIERKPVSRAAARRWVGFLTAAFPEGRTAIDAGAAAVDLSALTVDPDDEHVCALALTAAPATVITFDDGFIPNALAACEVTVAHPDAFLLAFSETSPDALVATVKRQAASWGQRPVTELLDAFRRAGVPGLADRLTTLVA